MKWISQNLVFLLMLDAAWVALGLMRRKKMWWWICLYWVLLTAKNAVDFAAGWW